MPVLSSTISLRGAESFPLFGYEIYILPSGAIFANEWVEPEAPGVQQVHDDEGRDYIVKGDPTVGMLYNDPDAFLSAAEGTLLDRIGERLTERANALRLAAGGEEE